MAEGKKGLLGRLRDIGGKVWDELAPAAGHVSNEVVSTLYTGSGFVQYPRARPGKPEQDSNAMERLRAAGQEAAGEPQRRDGTERSRGMEM